jgi:hypothetical protein
MSSIINAGVDGIILTASSTAALNIQAGGTNAIQISTGAATTITNATITTLTTSNPLVFPAGSASAPAVTTTGDTNTGIYFPAADQVAVTTGGTVAAGFNSNGLFFRNRIINGDMRIDQRNAGAAVTANDAFPVDRFKLAQNTDGACSMQQDTSVPAGFVNSLKYTTTTADGTLTTTQNTSIAQNIEGTNIADLAWGTANARTVTLSFWVRSSLTGTFGGAISNSAINRSYPFSYAISVADTWEYKTITIPGDTTGTWLTTTGIGMRVIFGLGVGPDRSGTAGAWAASTVFAPTGAVSVIGTLSATWYVTGVQLETGSVATPFERRPYGTELMLCQRYCYSVKDDGDGNSVFGTGMAFGNTNAGAAIQFPVTMRATPSTLTTTGTFNAWSSTGAALAVTATSLNVVSNPNIGWIGITVGGGGLVAGNATALYAASTTAQLTFSAEL